MGSLFVVIIPVRSHEFILRLLENDIYSLPALPVMEESLAEMSDSQNSIVNKLKVHEYLEEDVTEVLCKDIVIPNSKDVVLSYKISKNGKLLLEVTRDAVKLTHARRIGAIEKVTYGSLVQIETDGRKGSGGATNSLFLIDQDADDLKLTEMINNYFLEKHMEDTLTKYELLSATWEHSLDDRFAQVFFTVKADSSDQIINHLHAVGIGKKYESTLSVVSATVFTQEQRKLSIKKEALESSGPEEQTGKWNSFVQSIKARLTVAQVVQNVKANAVITFDFIVMVIVAGIIAAIGLLEDSSVNLIASMLVSPLMGPIMAFTFGAMIRDMNLIKIGVVSEIFGLFLCQFIGFLFGIFVEARPLPGPWANVKRWPTTEMASRAQLRSLWVGAGIAIPSGAGVALSILAGNAGSLVGVAISASLLPPCVNCGMFYGVALVIAIRQASQGKNPLKVPCNEYLDGVDSVSDKSDYWRNHSPIYCKNPLREYAIMGSISLCLTLVNIILIFFTGIIALKIKEVAPYTTKQAFERFWKHDLKHAREYNKSHTGVNALLENLSQNESVLKSVEDDYVFNQVKNRAMFHDEDVIETVKNLKEKSIAPNPSSSRGWFRWLGGRSSTSGVESKTTQR